MSHFNIGKYVQITKNVFDHYGQDDNPYFASFKISGDSGSGPMLNTDEVREILSNLGKSSVILVSLSGREPLLREDIGEILKHAWLQPFYTMITAYSRDLLLYPWEKYRRSVDFLKVLIDRRHNNLELFERLREICALKMTVCVQSIINADEFLRMEARVQKCSENGCGLLLLPDHAMFENGEHGSLVFRTFERELARLSMKYPGTVMTPDFYFRRAEMRSGGCRPCSVIIDSDGLLFYPCRSLGCKTVRLQETGLMDYINSTDAGAKRREMAACGRRCGWYQYFMSAGFSDTAAFWSAAAPYFMNLMGTGSRAA